MLLVAASSLVSCKFGGEGPDDFILGSWQLSSYTDNQARNLQQQSEFQALIAGLKINLTFEEDGTFFRSFQQGNNPPQENTGTYHFESDDKLLVFNVEKSPESKLLIVELTDTKLVLQLEEQGVATTMVFGR